MVFIANIIEYETLSIESSIDFPYAIKIYDGLVEIDAMQPILQS